MSHTNKTPYAELPQFEPSDKPTWLGDFNNAMTEIDAELSKQNTANVTQDSQIAEAIKKGDNALEASSEAKTAADEAKATADAVAKRLPVGTDDIANGSVTAQKLDTTAIESILQGMSIRVFDTNDPSADNAGMSVPNGVTLSGFYVPTLQMLVIRQFASNGSSDVLGGSLSVCYLPNYVVPPTKDLIVTQCGVLVSQGSNYFIDYSGVRINQARTIAVQSNQQKGKSFNNFGNIVAFLAPYTSGRAYDGVAYDVFKMANGVL